MIISLAGNCALNAFNIKKIAHNKKKNKGDGQV